MRTTRQSKRQEDHSSGAHDSENHRSPSGGSHNGEGSLAAVSKEAVGRLLKRATSRKAPGAKGRQEAPLSEGETKHREGDSMIGNGKRKAEEELLRDFSLKRCTNRNAERSASSKVEGGEGGALCDTNEFDWEEGTVSVSVSEPGDGYSHDLGREVTVEFTDSPASAQRKPARRASAKEKELAELVHKVHLLCLLARGRLVDGSCNDPLIQASLLSLLPSYLLKIVEVPRLEAKILGSLVRWFHDNFHIRSQSTDRRSFKSSLALALETREGSAEEIAALSVALFRALNLTTRFVSILDVTSLKPEADMCGGSNQDTPRLDTRIFSSTSTVASPNQVYTQNPVHSASGNTNVDMGHEALQRGKHHKRENSTCRKNLLKDLAVTGRSDDGSNCASASKAGSDNFDSCATKCAEGSKRKGDVEFEMQLEMALSATAAEVHDSKSASHDSSSDAPALKRLRKTKIEESAVSTSSSAVWSRKAGPPSCWAEVYCSGETLTGRWVHIDAANAIVDGEDKVEAAAAAWRRPLKYVVAFAGNGAKDVTRRYCLQWYKIAIQRVSSQWWDTVLAPLKELESGTAGSTVHLDAFQENASSNSEEKVSQVTPTNEMVFRDPTETSSKECPDDANLAQELKQVNKATDLEPVAQYPVMSCRNSSEDMELETRALTEPLPTNQLAYKSHHLYAIERWLTKNQILHPRGPVLGFCSGHPVYPRSCVQALQTKQRWLREGLQVRANEVPAKVVKRSKKSGNLHASEPGASEEADEATMELYGKWQLELLNLPHAVNGIVPKNERGQVDVWSEKCLPPGTVHLRLPRLVPVARRLEIDFAPAMVGFEFRNGRSVPIFDGIVVCKEFKDAIMEAYSEEEERREADEKKRNEYQALVRWFQLLSSIVTRQRLESSYVNSSSVSASHNPLGDQKSDRTVAQRNTCEGGMPSRATQRGSVQDRRRPAWPSTDDHEHVFPVENQSFDAENFTRTKRCPCGFSIQVEEL